MPRLPSKAILQHTMEFTALQILLWDDDDCNDEDMEFLEDLYACWSRLKVDDIWFLVRKALLGAILGYMCSTTLSTDFQIQHSRHVPEWDVHPSGNLFIFARTHRERQQSFIRMVESAPPNHVQYILGSSGSGAERARISLDIGYGTIWEYIWLFIRLLVHLARRYAFWPSPQQLQRLPEPLTPGQEIFSDSVGFLDGPEISLQSKPKNDHETYFSRKKIFGFNLQDISNWSGRFIYAATARIHDSTTVFCTENGRLI